MAYTQKASLIVTQTPKKTSPRTLRLGTRRSLLAQAQSRWVAHAIEAQYPEFRVELVGIETQGDQIQNLPLQQVEGKDFFVAELDRALLEERSVDLTVHSLKDLSLERPNGRICVAIPKREDPRDVILFNSKADRFLQEGKPIRLGTSSPRRLENLAPFLIQALPQYFSQPPSLEWVPLRGNVPTRLSRLHEPPSSPRALEGVVLALAGLIRLWRDPEGKKELEKQFSLIGKGKRWMILPLSENPTAPGQGALAVECRVEEQELIQKLSFLHDPLTAEQVRKERERLKQSGGGCHQRFGTTLITHPQLGNLQWTRGCDLEGQSLNHFSWDAPPPAKIENPQQIWDGLEEMKAQRSEEANPKEGSTEINLEQPPPSCVPEVLFITHPQAWEKTPPEIKKILLSEKEPKENPQSARIWTPGTSSWFHLAKKGLWVEGCTEGFGFQWAREQFFSPLLKALFALPDWEHWLALTHREGQIDWVKEGIPVFAPYQAYPPPPFSPSDRLDLSQKRLQKAQWIFWGSGSQVRFFQSSSLQTAHHACGPGKTSKALQQAGIRPTLFPSHASWKKWIQSSILSKENR